MLDFTDEQKMARQMLRQWADKELAPHVAKMEKGEILPYDIMRKLIRAFGMDEMVRAQFKKLEEAGEKRAGDGGKKERDSLGDPGMMAIVSMELSRVCPGFCLAFGASLGLAGGAIMAKGTLQQKLKWALPILTMEKIGAWGMTEPGAGSDAFGSMRTTARRDGDHFVLNGQKTFITNAPYADTFVIYAKLEGNEDSRYRPFHAFIIERGTPGLSTGKPMDKMGMHSSPTGMLFLTDVRVGKDRLLGGTEDRPYREGAKEAFSIERTGVAAMSLGIIDRCLELSLDYAKTCVRFGKPIGEHQLIQEKLARMEMHRLNVENLVFRTIEKSAAGAGMTLTEASVMKLYSARAAMEVALEAVQVFGGNGYMAEYEVEQLARDAKVLQIYAGTDEIQISQIARSLLA